MNNRADIIHDIFLLSSLIMEGYPERCQRLKNSLNVNLGPTCDTYMQFWEGESNEIIDKIKHLFSWSWQAGIVRTFIESVQNEVNWAMNRK